MQNQSKANARSLAGAIHCAKVYISNEITEIFITSKADGYYLSKKPPKIKNGYWRTTLEGTYFIES